MSKFRASDDDIKAFMVAIFPDGAELAMAAFDERYVLQEATRLIQSLRCDVARAVAANSMKTHEDRAYALRSEMCRLASWSRTPDEVAQALLTAVRADDAMLDEIDKSGTARPGAAARAMTDKLVEALKCLEAHAEAVMRIPPSEQFLRNYAAVISIAILETKRAIEALHAEMDAPARRPAP